MQDNREKVIVQTSIIGILANLFLAGFKAGVGILSNSISITLDAVNNLTDALSSVITIVGTRLANKAPDREHPLGHGRIEYLTASIISLLVLYAGFTSLIESGKKILHPEEPSYSMISLVIIFVAVLVKFFLSRFVKRRGEKVNSQNLIASGEDAGNDAILSLSVFLSALFFRFTGISLEAYVGVVISVFILKAGWELLQETLSQILGARADSKFTKEIKETINAIPGVFGTYDLFLHNYGPDTYLASAHTRWRIPCTPQSWMLSCEKSSGKYTKSSTWLWRESAFTPETRKIRSSSSFSKRFMTWFCPRSMFCKCTASMWKKRKNEFTWISWWTLRKKTVTASLPIFGKNWKKNSPTTSS